MICLVEIISNILKKSIKLNKSQALNWVSNSNLHWWVVAGMECCSQFFRKSNTGLTLLFSPFHQK